MPHTTTRPFHKPAKRPRSNFVPSNVATTTNSLTSNQNRLMSEAVLAAHAESAPATEVEPVEVQEAAQATSAPAGDQDAPPPSTEEIALASVDARIAKANGTEPEAKPDEAEPEAGSPDKDEPEATKTDEAKSPDLSQEAPKRFTERPEWQKLTAIGDKLGPAAGTEVRQIMRSMMERETIMAKQQEQFKPMAEAASELSRECGGEVGFNNMRTLVRQVNNDPAAAVPMLEKLIADAKQRAGLVVTSPDLLTETQKVDQMERNGEITAEFASQRRKEITELETHRAASKRTTAVTEQERERQATREAQQRLTAELSAIDDVETSFNSDKAKNDPDFKAVSPLFAKFVQLAGVNFQAEHKRNPSASEAKALLEKSYKEAKTEAMRFKPKPKAISPVRNNGSSTNTRHQPVTEQEKFEQRLAEAKARNT